MLSDFEQQLQTTLRQRLPVNIRSEVQVATGAQNQNGILLGVRAAAPLPPEMGGRRPERVPGANDPRRVVRLRCDVGIDFIPTNNNQTRTDLMTRLDLVLYALEAADVRDGSAFTGPAPDPGFLIYCFKTDPLAAPFIIRGTAAAPLSLAFTADGWFWPVGQAGESGIPIGEIRLRGVVHPVFVEPAAPTLVAGGPALTLAIVFDGRGRSRITSGPLASSPFGSLAVRLEKGDGTAGDGALSGGTAGAGGVRLVAVTAGRAQVTYTPPGAPTADILVVAVDNGENGAGLEIGRFPLTVEAGP